MADNLSTDRRRALEQMLERDAREIETPEGRARSSALWARMQAGEKFSIEQIAEHLGVSADFAKLCCLATIAMTRN